MQRRIELRGKGIMKIIDINDVPYRHIDIPGMTRTIKDILLTDKMTTPRTAVIASVVPKKC
jgi:hypothetical protein